MGVSMLSGSEAPAVRNPRGGGPRPPRRVMVAPTEWPLIGREAELAAIADAIDRPDLFGAVLVGPPGVGKTRVALAALAGAERAGCATRWVMASAAASRIPLGALGQVLPDWGHRDGPDSLPAAARSLRDAAGERRLVLGVNDAHLLDPMSTALVHHLAVTRAAFVLLTVPAGTVLPDLALALLKEGAAERVDVEELGRDRTDELVHAVLGGHVEGGTLHQLWSLSLGNPLYLRELVVGALTEGVLRDIDGAWRCDGPLTPTQRLADLVDARVGAVGGPEHAVVELLAVGGALDVDVLAALVPAEALELVERRGLVMSRRVGRRIEVRLAHPLHGVVLRRRTSPMRESEIARRLAAEFEARGARGAEDGLHVATWRVTAGLPADPDLLQAAAEWALRTDHRRAEPLARAAVEHGGGFRSSLLLGQILMVDGRCTEAEEVLSAIAGEADTDGRRARLTVTRAANWLWGGGADLPVPDHDTGLATESADLMAARAVFRARSGDAGGALECVTALRTSATDSPFAQAATAAVLARTGHVADALELPEPPAGDGPIADLVRTWRAAVRCEALAVSGRLDDAEQAAELGYRAALVDGRSATAAVFGGWSGVAASWRGQVRTALRRLREAAGVGSTLPLLPFLLAETARAAALAGDSAGARAAAEHAERALTSAGPEHAAWVALARAWLAATEGRRRQGVEMALAAADQAERNGHAQPLLLSLHTVVRFGAAPRVAGRLAEVAGRVQGELAAVFADHGRAEDGEALDSVAARFAALGSPLLAAEAAAEAADRYRGAGRNGAAGLASTRARGWAEACEGAVTPALALLASDAGLTPRELEIARLAAAGMTSRAIAEKLMVAVRTVDNVLYAVYAKLGVRGRRELAGALGYPTA